MAGKIPKPRFDLFYNLNINLNLKSLRKHLLVFTLLHPVYFIMSLYLNLDTPFLDIVLAVLAIGFYGYYLYFIWSLEAMPKSNKIFETVVALIFGVFAMWARVQFNDLELE